MLYRYINRFILRLNPSGQNRRKSSL